VAGELSDGFAFPGEAALGCGVVVSEQRPALPLERCDRVVFLERGRIAVDATREEGGRWLAVRTNPNVKKHKGISLFIVPMDTPGIKVLPIHVMGESDINQVVYEDVRVPASTRVGEENEGWRLITNQLNHERVTLCSSGVLERSFDEVRAWARRAELPDGRRVIDQEWVQINLARVYAGLEFLRLINWKVAWTATQGHLDVADASTIKVFGTEFYLEAFRLLFEVVGQTGYLKKGAPDSVLKSRLERYYRSLIILTFGGGVNEVQRDLIAVFGLDMPMAKR